MSREDVLEQICAAERKAARLMLEAKGIIAECKSSARNVVTEYDRRVQELLISELGAALPEAHFICEEKENTESLSAGQCFIIDPIDGTMNFVHGFNCNCISVAYAECGEIVVAAVYDPYQDEMFTAIQGKGAAMNGKPIHVDDCGLANSVVCVGTAPYRPEISDVSFALIKTAFDNSLDIRRRGAAALDLCSVAAGHAGLYFEMEVALWDYAAGLLIVTEAGGICSTLEWTDLPLDLSHPTIAAGGKRAREEIKKLICQ